jgi:hypothetical protein
MYNLKLNKARMKKAPIAESFKEALDYFVFFLTKSRNSLFAADSRSSLPRINCSWILCSHPLIRLPLFDILSLRSFKSSSLDMLAMIQKYKTI